MDADELRQAHAIAIAQTCGCVLVLVVACLVAAGVAMLLRVVLLGI